MACVSCLGCCPSGLCSISDVASFYDTVKCLVLDLGPCEATVRASRAEPVASHQCPVKGQEAVGAK